MSGNQTAGNDHRRFPHRGRWLALLVLAAATTPILLAAQSPALPEVLVLKSGFVSLFQDHVLLLTLNDVGVADATSDVTIEFRDASDKRRAFTSGVLSRSQTLQLRVRAESRREQFRAIVTISSITNAEGSERIVGLEDLDANSLRIETKPPCAPPSVGIGGEGNCGGWRVSWMTLEQARNSLD